MLVLRLHHPRHLPSGRHRAGLPRLGGAVWPRAGRGHCAGGDRGDHADAGLGRAAMDRVGAVGHVWMLWLDQEAVGCGACDLNLSGGRLARPLCPVLSGRHDLWA